MDDLRKRIDEMLANLKQERDELHVKAHLAKMDAGDEWTELEAKLTKLNAKAKELGGASLEASKDIGAAAKLLGEEIRAASRRSRSASTPSRMPSRSARRALRLERFSGELYGSPSTTSPDTNCASSRRRLSTSSALRKLNVSSIFVLSTSVPYFFQFQRALPRSSNEM